MTGLDFQGGSSGRYDRFVPLGEIVDELVARQRVRIRLQLLYELGPRPLFEFLRYLAQAHGISERTIEDHLRIYVALYDDQFSEVGQ
jgi:hypothetical protein